MTCVLCGSQTDKACCDECRDRLVAGVVFLRDRCVDLEVVAFKGVRFGRGGVMSRRGSVPFPLRVDAFELVGEVGEFARRLAVHLGLHHSRRTSVRALLTGVVVNVGRLVHSPQLLVVGRLVDSLVSRVREVFEPGEEDVVRFGVCERCGADLWGAASADRVVCVKCLHVNAVADLRIRLLRDLAERESDFNGGEWSPTHVYSASAISAFLSGFGGLRVSRKLVNQWDHRGFLVKRGVVEGEACYRLGDVVRLALQLGERHGV